MARVSEMDLRLFVFRVVFVFLFALVALSWLAQVQVTSPVHSVLRLCTEYGVHRKDYTEYVLDLSTDYV